MTTSFPDTHEPRLFTSESVTEGHPDKVADQISDAILDAHLAADPMSRVACETLVTTNRVVVAGEITSRASVDIETVVRETVRRIGYVRQGEGFDADSCRVEVLLDPQAGDIAMGVDTGGAGDQGLMFGYACEETPELMPLPIMLAHRLTRRLADVRRQGVLPWLRPDGKSQVTVEYQGGRPRRLGAVVVSCQHDAAVSIEEVRSGVREHVIAPVVPGTLLDRDTRLHINPTGRFVEGGPQADCGLTGRKIIVDTYGGAVPHGGGAFSGKDATKVDRSAAYMTRHVAKALVAAGLARRALVQVAYAIGVAEPVSVLVESFGTGSAADRRIAALVREVFDLRPLGLIEALQLRRPVYLPTAAYGHFGRTGAEFTWEHTDDAVARLRAAAEADGIEVHEATDAA